MNRSNHKTLAASILLVMTFISAVFAQGEDPVLAITTASLPAGTVGQAYSETLIAEPSDGSYTWSIVDNEGDLPNGLSLNENTGEISGNPTTGGTFEFTVKVTGTDDDDNEISSTQELFIIINAAPSITTTDLPSGTEGEPYTYTLAATGGTAPLTWSIESGALPSGLTLANGIISGTPTTANTFIFSVKVTDVNNAGATANLNITIAPLITVTYNITFNANGGAVSPTYGTTGSGGTLASLPTPTRSGYNFDGWYLVSPDPEDYEYIDVTTSTVFTQNTTIYARWSLITYTVTFNANGGTVYPPSLETGIGKTLEYLPDPSKEGHSFIGWFTEETGGTQVTTNTPFTSNSTIYAHWTISTYTVTFADGVTGAVLKNQTGVEYGAEATAPALPEKAGYNFIGWDNSFNYVTSNLLVTALYAIKTYTVEFKGFGGAALGIPQTITHGSAAAAPTPPRVEGHTFAKWDKAFDNVTDDLVVTAEYAINKYAVKFVDGSNVLLDTTVNHGTPAIAPAAAKEGYTLKGWDRMFSYVESDLTINALYNINTYTVSFVSHDSAKVLKTQKVEHGKSAAAPISAPAREGYTFLGWAVAYDNIVGDLIVAAQYAIKTYAVTFVGINSEVLEIQPVNHGEAAAPPELTDKQGYIYKGWDRAFDHITSPITVRAVYDRIVTPIANSKAAGSLGIALSGSSLKITGISQPALVSIYTLNGNLAMSRTVAPNESVSVAHLPKGVYLVKAGGKAVRVVR